MTPQTAARPGTFSGRLALILLSLLVVVGSCISLPPTLNQPEGRTFAAADVLFHRGPRWLGADAAVSVPLGPDRTLWLFGDTFIATSRSRVRTESVMVKNTVAVQRGMDPRTAEIAFYWRSAGTPRVPASFFPAHGNHWYWPGNGIRLDHGPLILFLYAIVKEPGPGLGFAPAGYAVVVIEHPDAPPGSWHPVIHQAPFAAFDAVPATAVLEDHAHIIAVAIRQHGTHAGALVRYPKADLARGDIRQAQWWAGKERGWIAESELGPSGPTFVLDDAGAECSIHYDERAGSFLHIASYGFGASTIGLRHAPALTGPWSAPVTVYRPPESNGPQPLVYAAKAHPELTGPTPSDLVVTYAANSFRFADLFTPAGEASLYWPRFALIPLGRDHRQ